MTETLQKMDENRDENQKLPSLLFFSEHGPQIVSMMDLQVEIL
jgi:hypothetical protein